MDLRTWILTDLADAHERFVPSIAAHVPRSRWRERAGGDGASIAALRFHGARHRDLAVTTAVRGVAPVVSEWWDALGLGGVAAPAGLSEVEDEALTARLDLDALDAYADAVHQSVAGWLGSMDLAALDTVPAASAHLEAVGVRAGDVPWLHAQWDAKPVAWFVHWPATGHLHGHVGEMTAVRNRMGLSPF